MEKGDKLSIFLAKARFAYILLYMIYIAVFPLTPIRVLMDGNPVTPYVYILLAGVGGLLLAVDFFHRQVLFTTRNCALLVAFLVACGISSVCNFRYGIGENFKTMVWTAIQLFLLLAIDAQQPKQLHFRQLRIFGEVFCAIWTAAVCWSLGMYLVQYSATYYFSDLDHGVRVGFSEGRLFGVFSDLNLAAVCSVVAAGLSVLFLSDRSSRLPVRIYHGISVFLQLCYIILSGSRTTQLALVGLAALMCGFVGWCVAEKKGGRLPVRVLVCLVALVLGGGVMQLTYSVGKTVLSYAPYLYETVTGAVEERPGQPEAVPSPDGDHRVDLDREDVTDNTDTSNGRIQIWSDYIRVFLKTPIVGTSPRNVIRYAADNFEDLYVVRRNYAAHNGYLALLVCTGILGAVPMLLWLVLAAVEVLGYLIRRRHDRDAYYRPVAVLGAVMIVLAVSMFPQLYAFFSNLVVDLLFWVIFGYTLGFIRMSEPERYRKKSVVLRITRKLLRKKENC